MELKLETNKKIILGNDFLELINEEGILDSTKEKKFYYNDIKSVFYLKRKINIIKSIANFFLMIFFDSLGNPISGKRRLIEFNFKNGEKYSIDVDEIDLNKIEIIINEINNKIKNTNH